MLALSRLACPANRVDGPAGDLKGASPVKGPEIAGPVRGPEIADVGLLIIADGSALMVFP